MRKKMIGFHKIDPASSSLFFETLRFSPITGKIKENGLACTNNQGGFMVRNFTLEYWVDEGWHVGRIKEVPGVFSQGETLEELEKNIQEAYSLMMADEDVLPHTEVKMKNIEVAV